MKMFFKRAFVVFFIASLLTVSLGSSFLITNAQATTDADAARQAALQAQLNDVLQQIADQQKILSDEQQTGASFQRDVNILTTQIKQAQLKIQAHQLAAQALGKDIDQKNSTITQLSGQIDKSHESLAQLIRKTNQIDEYSVTDVVLSDQDLSDFFVDLDAFDSIKQSIEVTLGYIKKTKDDTEVAKQALSQKQLQEIDEKISIQAEQAKIKQSEADKAQLLALSKQKQATYKSVINQKQAQAAAIRAALFGLRDTAAIPFGQALDFAIQAQKTTGVDPAFLLAILTQESALGQNVGSCYLSNTSTGDGIKVTTGAAMAKVMNPTRDVPPFLQITQALGRDPLQTRVSCPIAGVGWGGAMGPAQFIASTWELFADRVSSALGESASDPWNPQDAFLASAMYLADLGGVNGSYSAEMRAACKYYGSGGTSCSYGTQVMTKATSIQANMIDPLNGV